MKICCISNTGADLPPSCIDERGGFRRDTKFNVSTGSVYTVYAMTLRRGSIWYYISDDRGLPYPVWYPAPLFSVVDGSLSRHWMFAHGSIERDGDIVLAFREWADDPAEYYDRLSDRDPDAIRVFQRYKKWMDAEGVDGEAPLSPRT